MTTTPKSTETITDEEKLALAGAKHDLIVFWLRMIGWLLSGCVMPITVFAIKFGLFNSYGYQVTTDELGNITGTTIALNGWGIASVILVAFTAYQIINEIIKSHSGYSLTKQILTGILHRLIPLLAMIMVCYWLKGCLEEIIFCLGVIALGQCAAIPLNPLPAWRAKKTSKEDYSDILTGLFTLIKNKGKRGSE